MTTPAHGRRAEDPARGADAMQGVRPPRPIPAKTPRC